MTRLFLGLRHLIGTLVLALAYFAILTPVALATRWLRDDPLALRLDSDAPTYLMPCETQPPESLLALLWSRGKWWLIPVLVVLLLAGLLVAASELSVGLAFLYPLF